MATANMTAKTRGKAGAKVKASLLLHTAGGTFRVEPWAEATPGELGFGLEDRETGERVIATSYANITHAKLGEDRCTCGESTRRIACRHIKALREVGLL